MRLRSIPRTRRGACSLAAALLVTAAPAQVWYGPPQRGPVVPIERRPTQGAATTTIAEQYLLQSINAERARVGLAAVRFDERLQQAAYLHAVQIALANDLSHRLRGEPDLFHRGYYAGARFSRISENLATGISLPEMHIALMHSTHHRENILDGYVQCVGIAVIMQNGSLWAVEDFSDTVA